MIFLFLLRLTWNYTESPLIPMIYTDITLLPICIMMNLGRSHAMILTCPPPCLTSDSSQTWVYECTSASHPQPATCNSSHGPAAVRVQCYWCFRGLCVYYCSSFTGTREEPGTLTQCTQGGAPFSLVPLVWESNQNPRVSGASPTTSPLVDLIPTIRGPGARPRRGWDP